MIDALIQSVLIHCTSVVILYLSTIERLIGHKEIEFKMVYFFPFYTKYDTWFWKYHIELTMALSATNATKNEVNLTHNIGKANSVPGIRSSAANFFFQNKNQQSHDFVPYSGHCSFKSTNFMTFFFS